MCKTIQLTCINKFFFFLQVVVDRHEPVRYIRHHMGTDGTEKRQYAEQYKAEVKAKVREQLATSRAVSKGYRREPQSPRDVITQLAKPARVASAATDNVRFKYLEESASNRGGQHARRQHHRKATGITNPRRHHQEPIWAVVMQGERFWFVIYCFCCYCCCCYCCYCCCIKNLRDIVGC
jgi:hypothetical protein